MHVFIDWPRLLMAFFGGVGIGICYFAGLWWTIHRLTAAAQPAFWIFGSFLIRGAIAVIGLYAVTGGRWPGILLALLGFTVVRVLSVRWSQPPASSALAGQKAAKR